MQKNQLRKQFLSIMKLCVVQKKFWNIEREMERLSTWSSGSPILRINQRGNRNTIFWIDVSLINISNHKNNSSFYTLPCCLAYISLIFCYPWIEFGNTQNISVHEFMNAVSPFLKSRYNLVVSCCLQCHEYDKFLSSELHHLLSVTFALGSEGLLYNCNIVFYSF